jgi:hypothetical protein
MLSRKITQLTRITIAPVTVRFFSKDEISDGSTLLPPKKDGQMMLNLFRNQIQKPIKPPVIRAVMSAMTRPHHDCRSTGPTMGNSHIEQLIAGNTTYNLGINDDSSHFEGLQSQKLNYDFSRISLAMNMVSPLAKKIIKDSQSPIYKK